MPRQVFGRMMHLDSVAGAGPAGLGRAVVNRLAGDVETHSALIWLDI
jgi:hypothetical protein